MKRFYIEHNIGKCKYVVNFHDGKSKHSDGSDFFDVKIFKNKKNLAEFVSGLLKDGYVETTSYLEGIIQLQD